MRVEQTSDTLRSFAHDSLRHRLLPRFRLRFWREIRILLVLMLLGSSAIPARMARDYQFGLAVAGQGFNLIAWEIDALSEKAQAFFEQPSAQVMPALAPQLVESYLARAARIGAIERELNRRATGLTPTDESVSVVQLQNELGQLRLAQNAVRPTVEQIIQRQIGTLLAEEGFGTAGRVWPPVQFTFTEPPRKLVVSPRDQIATIYYQMLAPEMELAEIESAEQQILAQQNAVGYITEIGGLGAFPTMVVDRASLGWVLSTVAHEWVHNYLVFFPLGWNYFASQEMTTLNETVAEIVGNEIGEMALARFYAPPPVAPAPVAPAAPDAGVTEAPAFDFGAEMRETRLEVDRLLAAGDVAGAEAYMEARRQMFVDEGYPLRVLNQAYFAFHGSYGTSAASTSPIGPMLAELRAQMPDLLTFLNSVRWFTSVEDLEQALIEWGVAPSADRP
jgi:hypothetical protein